MYMTLNITLKIYTSDKNVYINNNKKAFKQLLWMTDDPIINLGDVTYKTLASHMRAMLHLQTRCWHLSSGSQ